MSETISIPVADIHSFGGFNAANKPVGSALRAESAPQRDGKVTFAVRSANDDFLAIHSFEGAVKWLREHGAITIQYTAHGDLKT